jgi:hypothetical protein
MAIYSGLVDTAIGWASSGMFWTLGVILIVGFIGYFYLVMKRRGKMKYICLELVPFGNGKAGINRLKAGIFKTKSMFGGLIDYGNENVFKTEDNRRILNAKTSYLHDIMGKKGFICVRKQDDPKILVAIKKIQFDNLELMMQIAPADFRDVSANIVQDAIKETTGTWEKILPYIAIGLIVVLVIISLIINQQMTNNTINKVGDLLIGGCQNAHSVAPATTGTP